MNPLFTGWLKIWRIFNVQIARREIEVFGKPKGEEEAKRNSIPYLGELPIDPLLAELSDAGKIEDYQSPAFDQIAKRLAEEIKKNSDKKLA